MTISSIPAAGTKTPTQAGNIGIEGFLNILTTQLNYQDPLKPVENKEFVAQIAQFATLEQSRELNAKIDQLLTSQGSTQVLGLLGKTVTLTTKTTDGFNISGPVTHVTISAQGEFLMTVNDTRTSTVAPNISLSQIEEIH